MRLSRALVVVSIALLTVMAQAHIFLEHAEPKVGSTVASAPSEVRIWFSEALEPASTAEVTDASGNRRASGPARVDARDPRLLEVPLAELGPGEYTVVWRAVSADTHVTQGRFTFRVGE